LNEEILEQYKLYLRGKYQKKNTWRTEIYAVSLFIDAINKPIKEINEFDMIRWKSDFNHKYKRNSQARILSSLNRFLKYIGKNHLKQPIPKIIYVHKKTLSSKEFNDYIETSKQDPVWHLIAILQTDGLLRPGEFGKLKLSNIDYENHRFYLDDTKTGDNYIIISPMIENAIQHYLPYRLPKTQYQDYLIIVPNGKYQGMPCNISGEYIRNITKRIAASAGIQKKVTPYTIKRTSITLDFDQQVNPRIIQRKARHKNIKTTLIYDHTDDKKLIEYFQRKQHSFSPRTDEERKRLLTDQYLQGKIDLQTYKQSLDLLETNEHKKTDQFGYA